MLNILVPLDGSRHAEQALPHAVAMAKAFDARITVLRVLTRAEYHSDAAFDQVDWALSQRRAASYLDELTAQYGPMSTKFAIRLAEGRAAETIAQVATEIGADMLVMGRHGAGQSQEFPRGSVAGKLASTFAGSLLLVQAGDQTTNAACSVYRKLYVPIDGTPQSECCLKFATALAQAHGTALQAVYFVEPIELPAGVAQTTESLTLVRRLSQLAMAAAQRRVAELRAQLPIDLEADISIRMNPDVFAAVTCEASDCDASMVIAPPHLLHANDTGGSPDADTWKRYASLPLLFFNPAAQACRLEARRPADETSTPGLKLDTA